MKCMNEWELQPSPYRHPGFAWRGWVAGVGTRGFCSLSCSVTLGKSPLLWGQCPPHGGGGELMARGCFCSAHHVPRVSSFPVLALQSRGTGPLLSGRGRRCGLRSAYPSFHRIKPDSLVWHSKTIRSQPQILPDFLPSPHSVQCTHTHTHTHVLAHGHWAKQTLG